MAQRDSLSYSQTKVKKTLFPRKTQIFAKIFAKIFAFFYLFLLYRFRLFIVSLHEEIIEFVRWISPTPEEQIMRQDVIQRISNVIYNLWPNADVREKEWKFPRLIFFRCIFLDRFRQNCFFHIVI